MHIILKSILCLLAVCVAMVFAMGAEEGTESHPASPALESENSGSVMADPGLSYDPANSTFKVGGAAAAGNDTNVSLNLTLDQANLTLEENVSGNVYDIESHFRPRATYQVDKYFRIKPTYDVNKYFRFKPAVRVDDWPFVCNIV
ncbi:MAG: hypothetical protein GKC10_06880 [Methanosarcinales archaeon]|nr:hypothetical protein [Methanosarcinales archaeon]